ncbi:hypothetical protein QTJ16_002368 [Diplocarpon rosae]|uniref:DNA-directed RNA polymerase n=1 Tax=Diplocarpon rosae TaxID=946125 RepID=A0AAD9WDL4_9HELO|nr:hypothetical protein QTJ16_002368 [Diplocarpon rosae]
MDDIPFEGAGGMPPPGSPKSGHRFGEVSSVSGFQPLYLGGSVSLPFPKYTRNNKGIGGNLTEIQSVFDACLQVGRIERAGVILQRIAQIGINGSELIKLHNRYLRAAVEQVMMSPGASALQELHDWFELHIRFPGVPQTTETIAYMVKASLQSTAGKREKLVNRYMDMLDEDSALQLLEADVLTAHEIQQITEIYPKYNFAVEMDEDWDALEEAETDQTVQPDARSPVPNVRPTGQKGLGLRSLKKSLSLFSSLPNENMGFSSATREMKRDLQARLEEDAVESAIDRWREESANLKKMGFNSSLQTKSIGARMWKWQEALDEYFKEEIKKVNAAEEVAKTGKMGVEDIERVAYGPFLRLLPTGKLAAVTILSAMNALGNLGADRGVTLSNAIMAIAKSVEDESVFEVLQKESKKKIWPRGKYRLPDPKNIRRAARFRGAAARTTAEIFSLDKDETAAALSDRNWPMSTRAKVGAFLMSALIEVAKVPVTLCHPETGAVVAQMQPAFSHSHQYKAGKKVGIIMVNKALVKQLKREPVHSLLAKHLPMLVEPEPWSEFSKGGFIAHPAKVMRIKSGDQDQRHYAEAAIGQGDMALTFKGLDVLGKQPWRINKPVFNVMLEAWNSGEAVASMPPESPKLTMPPEPATTQDPLERRKWIREVKNIENTRSGLHSQRCFQNFQLEIARALRNEVFYFPHNIDFRGRAYPIPPYLNHMGADHCRGLLTFGEGKKLGVAGLRWLKIHAANVYGFDKASLSEREAFVTNHIDQIYDSATNPLGGSRWWLTAEDPWQFLAACMELKNALESPDPTHFVSNLPVHQDGTCNGLQHYAALGGDTWGARQVNLEPGDRPADVYTAVADLVKESIAEDLAKGNQRAVYMDGKITRKVVKQTVMTNVYGVTYVGAKAQVRRQLVTAYPDLPNNDFHNPGTLSAYVATKIFAALSTMFQGAHDIQFWLGECANRISSCLTAEQISRLEAEWPRLVSESRGQRSVGRKTRSFTPASVDELTQFKTSVIWTTPLHMPVVQPYRCSKSKIIATNMQNIHLSEPHRSDPVSKRKQLQGFPPNFVHSLDATHMLLSALQCDELGVSFAAVHDSFWTHASDVDQMNTVLREAFIRIHSEDVVGRLRSEFTTRYNGAMYIASLRAGTPVVERIKEWRKSQNAKKPGRMPKSQKTPFLNELLLERERMRLLASSNPEEVQQGEDMVTPTSIFQKYAADQDLIADAELEHSGLGVVSSRDAKEDEVSGSDDSGEIAEMTEGRDKETNEDEFNSSFERTFNTKREYEGKVPQVWLPLTFPPVPKKVRLSGVRNLCDHLLTLFQGEFDVSRLRDSQYFFS